MHFAVLSNVHGNLPALEAVWADMQSFAPDGIIIAGDLVGGGPQPNEAVRLLRSTPHWTLSGTGPLRCRPATASHRRRGGLVGQVPRLVAGN